MSKSKIDPTELLGKMSRNTLNNYIVPGLSSSLIGGEAFGTVRLFESARQHQESIVPHSHRFDFMCLVVAGSVLNEIWTEDAQYGEPALGQEPDLFQVSNLIYQGEPGKYEREPACITRYSKQATKHEAGEWYGMKAHEVHSIYFSRGAKVLFFEGPAITERTIILEPYVHDEVVPTFEVKPWMFQPAKPF